MNYWLAQLVLAARRSSDRDNGWVQILVFVILAIFYAVGSIISKAKKTAPKGKEQAPRKPVRKSPEDFIDLQMLKQLFGLPEEAESSSRPQPQVTKPQIAKPQVQPTRRKVARPQPVVQKTPIETSKIPVMEPQVQPKLEKVPGLTPPLGGAGLTGEAEVPTEIPQAKYLNDILSDYDDPEKLRRAILHYEILGKPLSLREPSEHTIGF
jgi:hypothetical protein